GPTGRVAGNTCGTVQLRGWSAVRATSAWACGARPAPLRPGTGAGNAGTRLKTADRPPSADHGTQSIRSLVRARPCLRRLVLVSGQLSGPALPWTGALPRLSQRPDHAPGLGAASERQPFARRIGTAHGAVRPGRHRRRGPGGRRGAVRRPDG